MEWEFTPEQVVGCQVDYGLEQFRADMLEEVKLNMGEMDDARQLKIFNAMYELCYWVATGNEYDDFLDTLDQDSFFPGFLASIRDNLEPNIVMLGAQYCSGSSWTGWRAKACRSNTRSRKWMNCIATLSQHR